MYSFFVLLVVCFELDGIVFLELFKFRIGCHKAIHRLLFVLITLAINLFLSVKYYVHYVLGSEDSSSSYPILYKILCALN